VKQHSTTVVGLDVHKATIVAAVLPPEMDRATRTFTIENEPKAVERMVQSLTSKGPVEFVYEAGPCGYQTHRQIAQLGQKCVLIAPGLIPKRPTDHVKTDRRDAENLAGLYRAGQLTEIRIPTREEEAARDLVRAREDGLADRLRARHRLMKFLLRQGRVYRETKSWTITHRAWLKTQKFEWAPLEQTFEGYMQTLDDAEARLKTFDQQLQDLSQREAYRTPVSYLRCLKGIDTLSALTLIVEAQDFRRFERAASFMSFTGLVSSEYSSGEKVRRGAITKAGNTHIRRILVEAAWSNRNGNVASRELLERRKDCPAEIVRIAQKAQKRLHRKYWRMLGRSKPHTVTVAAVARELAGFVWSIGQHFPPATTTA
jgi:transposase